VEDLPGILDWNKVSTRLCEPFEDVLKTRNVTYTIKGPLELEAFMRVTLCYLAGGAPFGRTRETTRSSIMRERE
jgi:hypothetical protein